jgi:hypothetical protein
MVWFAGAMVNAILRCAAIIINSVIAKVYGRLKAQQEHMGARDRLRFDSRFESNDAVLDADFETVEAEPNLISMNVSALTAPKTGDATPDPMPFGTDNVGMSVFAKKSANLVPDDSTAFYGFATVLVLLSFWVFGGHTLFRNVDTMPVASIRNAATGSEIADAAWRVVTINGKTALHVEGIVRNPGAVAVHTKPVTVTVKHGDGSTKRYLLGQKGWTLGPGQEVVVSGRLDIASTSIASVVIALSD